MTAERAKREKSKKKADAIAKSKEEVTAVF
jgi:hypothetical protein